MPNRIIKESLCTSEKISNLDDFAFRVWIGLIIHADDYGRGDARPAIIKGRVFPLRERLPLKNIQDALDGLAADGCVDLYTVDGKPYYQFPGWQEHQRVRNAKPKYPAPEGSGNAHLASVRGELRRVAASCGELPPNPIQSNPNPIQSEAESNACARDSGGGSVEKYALANLMHLSPTNLQELASFIDDLPEEIIRYAVDKACADGRRMFSYVRTILNNCAEMGFRTAAEAESDWERRKAYKSGKPAEAPAAPKRERRWAD